MQSQTQFILFGCEQGDAFFLNKKKVLNEPSFLKRSFYGLGSLLAHVNSSTITPISICIEISRSLQTINPTQIYLDLYAINPKTNDLIFLKFLRRPKTNSHTLVCANLTVNTRYSVTINRIRG